MKGKIKSPLRFLAVTSPTGFINTENGNEPNHKGKYIREMQLAWACSEGCHKVVVNTGILFKDMIFKAGKAKYLKDTSLRF